VRALSWYVGCLSVAWGFILVALIAIVSSPVWAGNNCQPVPQPTSEKIAEIGIVVAFAAALGAGFAVVDGRKKPPFARRVSVILVTLAACAVMPLLGFHHAPSCPAV
jgi:peptidoglycan/LPS O-acetylase OafA/YrhL